jgi:hypothetical protein
VRELCTRYNVLMIADEGQTGLCRTGKAAVPVTEREKKLQRELRVETQLGERRLAGVIAHERAADGDDARAAGVRLADARAETCRLRDAAACVDRMASRLRLQHASRLPAPSGDDVRRAPALLAAALHGVGALRAAVRDLVAPAAAAAAAAAPPAVAAPTVAAPAPGPRAPPPPAP